MRRADSVVNKVPAGEARASQKTPQIRRVSSLVASVRSLAPRGRLDAIFAHLLDRRCPPDVPGRKDRYPSLKP
jgi:hypothetical protein